MPAPILRISTTSQFSTLSTFRAKQGGTVTVYRPTPQNSFFSIGDATFRSGISPVVTLAAANDDPASPLLKNPIGYSYIGGVLDVFPTILTYFFQPIAPD